MSEFRRASFIFGCIEFTVEQWIMNGIRREPRLHCMHGGMFIDEYPNEKVQNIARFMLGNAEFKQVQEYL